MKDKNRKLRITTAAAASLVLIFIAVCAVYIGSAWRLARLCDISDLPADIDYLNIHESGSITGRRNVDTTIFKEGEKFFLEYIDHSKSDTPERTELTRTEFLLCTYVDERYLEEAPPSTASDNVYYEITICRQDGSEVTVPRKSYALPYFGLIYLISEKEKYTADSNFDYDKLIRLASYLYAQNVECSMLSANSVTKEIPYNMYFLKKNIDFPLDMRKEIREISLKLRNSKKPEYIAEKEAFLKECEKLDWGGSTAYCKDLGDDEFYGFYLVCFEPKDRLMFLCERPEGVSCKQLKKDLISLFADDTADIATRITFPVAAGGVLIIALAVYALVRSRRKALDETEGSTNEADKDQA